MAPSPPSSNIKRMRNVALIGSSGGGTATVGHTEADTLLQTIHAHLSQIEARLELAIYISLLGGKSMDAAQPSQDRASLFVATSKSDSQDLECQCVATDTLERINEQASRLQRGELASKIAKGEIHALICISIHVPLFADTLRAAADSRLPVTGTGGSSLAQALAQFSGLALSGNAGGSVATTTQTRAISYTYSLAQAFNRTQQYRPWQHSQNHSSHGPSWTSILNAALPVFWTVTLTKFLLKKLESTGIFEHDMIFWKHQGDNQAREELTFILFALDHFVLPSTCAILAATACHQSSYTSLSTNASATSMSSLIMASSVASFGCRDSVVAGLTAGYMVQKTMERWVIYPCIFANVPATMTTLLATGGTGSVIGLVSGLVVAPAARSVTWAVRFLIHYSITDSATLHPQFPVVAAFVWGCLSCWSSKVGYYHAIHLPLILIELERGEGSFLGAVDELTLVLVCAGICAAKTLSSNKTTTISDRALCHRGLLINLLAGDFVEVCYPYMEQFRMVNVSGYLGSGLSCSVLVYLANQMSDATNLPPSSSAYLPWLASLALADQNWYAMLVASAVAFLVPFLFSSAAIIVSSKRDEHRKKQKL